MASGSLKISPSEVRQIAQRVEDLNNDLSMVLKNSQSTINNLSNIWRGRASNATIGAYNDFAKNYFEQYARLLQDYVTFLRTSVADDYDLTENTNVDLGQAFR